MTAPNPAELIQEYKEICECLSSVADTSNILEELEKAENKLKDNILVDALVHLGKAIRLSNKIINNLAKEERKKIGVDERGRKIARILAKKHYCFSSDLLSFIKTSSTELYEYLSKCERFKVIYAKNKNYKHGRFAKIVIKTCDLDKYLPEIEQFYEIKNII